ncbi:alpha/beta hydrolase [Acinetobacter sp. GXMZU3951]
MGVSIHELIEKNQSTAARLMDKLPNFVQENIVKALSYPYHYPELDSFIKCILAVQHKQNKTGFISTDAQHSRKAFELQSQLITGKATRIKQVEDLRLPLQSGTIFARHYHPAPNKKLPLVVFYHGGGFVVGSMDSYDEVCRVLALHANVQVLSIDYPLAPEASPYQVVQSCEDALAWAYQNRKQLKVLKNRIAVAGDSAGGNLSAVVAQRSAGKAYAPQVQFLIYPALDFKSRHPSFFAYKDGLILTGDDVDTVTAHYATQHQVALDDPLISPTYGNLKKLASAFVVTAGHDVLHDEAKIYAYKLRHQGVAVAYQDYPAMTHGFINMTGLSQAAKKNYIEMAKKFRRFWNKQS